MLSFARKQTVWRGQASNGCNRGLQTTKEGVKRLSVEEFGERVRACQARLYRVAVSILRNHADAEDAVSEALLKAWKHVPGLRNDAYFETWLTRIVINECRALLRRGRAHAACELTEVYAAEEPPDVELRMLIDALPEKYRLPLVMKCALDMTYDEIARALHLPRGAVKWRVEQGKKRVRREAER